MINLTTIMYFFVCVGSILIGLFLTILLGSMLVGMSMCFWSLIKNTYDDLIR